MKYQKRFVDKAILMALQDLGGSASREMIRKTIAENQYDGLRYEDVYASKDENNHTPFMEDFTAAIQDLYEFGYIEQPRVGEDIVTTDLGRRQNLADYETKHDSKRHSHQQPKQTTLTRASEAQDLQNADWKADLLKCLMQFSPAKFESFSRLLISKMGVRLDKERGIKLTGDHGIDGFGYFMADDFRTSRVAIQCKRYGKQPVSEPEIDKFKGVMASFNADYGIFITTSHFTAQAEFKAYQGSNTVTLIDGQQLAELVEKYQLHIKPVKIYVLDDYYYQFK